MRPPRNPGWSSPEYHVQVRFRAPLPFVYAWCTDFTPNDAALEGGSYERRILVRTPRQVIFEDLEDGKDGWAWSRKTVDLDPPRHWRMDGIGNRRDIRARYALSTLSDGRTQLDLWARRRARMPGYENPRKADWERDVAAEWKGFASHLEKDFRGARKAEPSQK